MIDQCDALLTAGLADEAVELARARSGRGSLSAVELAELVLAQAVAELAAGEPAASLRSATHARTLFRRQGREWNALNAELAVLRARFRRGPVTRAMARAAADVGTRLEAGGSDDAVVAWILAGRVGLALREESAAAGLERAASYRHHGSGLVRATAWHAAALARDTDGWSGGVLSACRRGLEALDEHRASLGSSELRALATRRGDEVASLALRHAARAGARVLLVWSERWRANALFQPAVHARMTPTSPATWRHCRDTRRRLAAARAEGSPAGRRGWTTNGLAWSRQSDGGHIVLRARRPRHPRFRIERLVESLGDIAFVELVGIDGVLHALVARSGRVTHEVVGAIERGRAGGRVRTVRVAAGGARASGGPGRRRTPPPDDAAR